MHRSGNRSINTGMGLVYGTEFYQLITDMETSYEEYQREEAEDKIERDERCEYCQPGDELCFICADNFDRPTDEQDNMFNR